MIFWLPVYLFDLLFYFLMKKSLFSLISSSSCVRVLLARWTSLISAMSASASSMCFVNLSQSVLFKLVKLCLMRWDLLYDFLLIVILISFGSEVRMFRAVQKSL